MVNAGHFIPTDKGAVCEKCGFDNENLNEAELVMKIRDELVPMLKHNGFDVTSIPDDRNLRESIEIANVAAPKLNDGLLIDIHLNHHQNPEIGGVEVYSGTSVMSAQISRVLSANIARVTHVKDRGYKPHTLANVGTLGWIAKTNAWAAVVECLYLSNKANRDFLLDPVGPKHVARGILAGICELYGVSPLPFVPPARPELDLNKLQLLILELKIKVVNLWLEILKKSNKLGKF